MRLARTALAATVLATGTSTLAGVAQANAASTLAGAAQANAAEKIIVEPRTAHPGQTVHISVAGCSVGLKRHWAASPAFAHRVTLGGKGVDGEGTPKIKKTTRSGRYAIIAHCDSGTVQGTILVATHKSKLPATPPAHAPTQAKPTVATDTISAKPAASHSKSSNAPYIWGVVIVVLFFGGGAGAFFIRRRG